MYKENINDNTFTVVDCNNDSCNIRGNEFKSSLSFATLTNTEREVKSRVRKLMDSNIHSIEEYNQNNDEKIPYIFLIMIDYNNSFDNDRLLTEILKIGRLTGVYTVVIGSLKNVPADLRVFYEVIE